MSKFTPKLEEWGKTPTGIQGTFWNEVLDFERDELLYPVADIPPGTPTNVNSVEMRGCSRETEAARLLRHLAEQAREMPFSCTWDAHPGCLRVQAGDIVTMRTRFPYATGNTATQLKVRVLAGMASRDEQGELSVKYAGRIMASSSYTLQPVTVPVTQFAVKSAAKTRRRLVSHLRARAVAR